MKRFLVQLGLGFGMLITWILLNDLILQPLVIKHSLRGFEDVEIVILGDSHGERIWLDNSLNFARGGDPPLVQLRTLESALPHLPGLRHVVVGLGPQNFSALPHKRIHDNHTRFLTGNSARLACIQHLTAASPSMKYFAHQLVGELKLSQGIPFCLEVNAYDSSCDLSMERTHKRLNRHEVISDNWFLESNSSNEAMSSLAVFTEQRETLQVWLIGTPLHSSYRERVGNTGWTRYQDFLDKLARQDRVSYVSMEAVDLPDSLYFDADHVNGNGMTWLSDTLSRIITPSNNGVN